MKVTPPPPPNTKQKSTNAAKNERINVCLDLLRQGKKRAEILEHIQTYYNISKAQVDNYLHEASEILASERAETYETLKAARKFRDIEAAKLIPTNAELIAMLCRKIDLDNPVPTGYELKPIDGIFQNVPRFASETFYLTAIAKIIDYNNNLAASTNTNENTIQAVLVINTSERLIENEDELTE
jgi:hypothetical protein